MKIKKCTNWDGRFFSMCNLVASWSEDPSRKVGSVIVSSSKEIRATGYNGLPRGVSHKDIKRFQKEADEKYKWFEHAERNAIFNIARSGSSSADCIIYCNSFPCADCSRAIIQSGIVELRTFAFDLADPRFGKEFMAAETMLKEANVEISLYDPDDPKIRLQSIHKNNS